MKYNKLVRDKIPELISKGGDRPVTHILDTESYRRELKRKLQEEVAEFNEADDVEELVDILEVVYALANDRGLSRCQLEQLRQQKRETRGGFDKRVFLEEVTSKDDNL